MNREHEIVGYDSVTGLPIRKRDGKGNPILKPFPPHPNAVMVCSCGTWWLQKDVDEFNKGNMIFAYERHADAHKHSSKEHKRIT